MRLARAFSALVPLVSTAFSWLPAAAAAVAQGARAARAPRFPLSPHAAPHSHPAYERECCQRMLTRATAPAGAPALPLKHQWCAAAPSLDAAAALAARAFNEDRRHEPYTRPTENMETRRT